MSSEERNNFSMRLKKALADADFDNESPTRLAREFNRRTSDGNVTTHAARKWLLGEAIPTQAKLRILAQWLDVSTEWLRFGVTSRESLQLDSQMVEKEKAILDGLRILSEQDRQKVHEYVRLLVAANKRK